jgi:tripartite-type tricarboxylate transporter receptor subunit TctC
MTKVRVRVAGWASLIAIMIAFMAAFTGPPTSAAAAEVSFKGNINVIIGTTPGGGTDGTTRLVGRYLGKYLPGKPNMIYRNMPAGGGLKATNYLANQAKRDGTVWMGGDGDYIDAETLRRNVAKFDPRAFHFIGGISRGGTVVPLRKEKLAKLLDKSKGPVIFGSQDGTGSLVGLAMWAAEARGWNLRFVIGYPGTGALALASRRGEIDGFGTSDRRVLNALFSTGAFKGVVQVVQSRGGKIVARSSFPNVPTLESIVSGRLSGLAKRAFAFWYTTNQIDKWYALPPKTPAKIVDAYRKAFTQAVKDPEFFKFGKHQFSADLEAQTGGELARLVASSSYPSAEINAYEVKLRVKYGLPTKPLTDAELAKLAKKLIKYKEVTSALKDIKRKGRILYFQAGAETHKVKVSGRRTKVTIAGNKTKRKHLKVGMTCTFTYPENGGEARRVDCK